MNVPEFSHESHEIAGIHIPSIIDTTTDWSEFPSPEISIGHYLFEKSV